MGHPGQQLPDLAEDPGLAKGVDLRGGGLGGLLGVEPLRQREFALAEVFATASVI